MSAAQAVDLVIGLGEAGVHMWVIGGWGVDSLAGSQTRDHHDLDLLVRTDDLPALERWLLRNGFTRSYVWSENRAVRVEGATFDTAFVERHADGRELDVHGVQIDGQGCPRLATTDPWELPHDALTGVGFLDGRQVPCVTRNAQVLMHLGYELSQQHHDDLAILSRLPSDNE